MTPGAVRDWLLSIGAEFVDAGEMGAVAVLRHRGLDAVRIGPSGTDDPIPSTSTLLADLADTLDVSRELLEVAIREDWSIAEIVYRRDRIVYVDEKEAAGE
jgi:hypothetical protein